MILLEFRSEKEWLEAIVGRFAEALPLGRHGHVCLAGGSTPEPFYRHLSPRLPEWEQVTWWLGDERLDPARRNEKMIRAAFASSSFDDRFESWAVQGEGDQVAQDYENRLRSQLPPSGRAFDFCLLGLGDDGHTASLFPGAAELDVVGRWAVATRAEHLGCRRVTLTFPLLERSRDLCFVVRGAAKERVVRRVLAGDASLPASRLSAATLLWLREE